MTKHEATRYNVRSLFLFRNIKVFRHSKSVNSAINQWQNDRWLLSSIHKAFPRWQTPLPFEFIDSRIGVYLGTVHAIRIDRYITSSSNISNIKYIKMNYNWCSTFNLVPIRFPIMSVRRTAQIKLFSADSRSANLKRCIHWQHSLI